MVQVLINLVIKNLVLDCKTWYFRKADFRIFSSFKIKNKIIGDESLSKRDLKRIVNPLEKFGAKFKTNSGKLPITIQGQNIQIQLNILKIKDLLNVKVV